jgi:asparagine synthase (glutamine-hydrolysing)
MCGIAGILSLDGRSVEQEQLLAMAERLRHRGPDGSGHVADGAVGLAHQRLAIIDLVSGDQPMAFQDHLIVFNGEIYNYIELRNELMARGRTFRTSSDTEVILQLYDEFGPEAVPRLNGMFAFVLWDRRRRRALMARDHFGIKPLYLHVTPERVLFASEIKALLVAEGVRAEADPDAVWQYLTFQYVLGGGTMFRGVSVVGPGEYQLLDLVSGHRRVVRYWEPTFNVDSTSSEEMFAERIGGLLEDAIRLQLRSDVPVGAYLSGGMDSSIVTLLAARHLGDAMPVFTGRFDEGPEFDESGYARIVAESCHASLHLITPTADEFVAELPRLIYHMDEPVAGPGLFPQAMVSREASRHVKVVLGGQGGDEVFGGYARYLLAYFEQVFKGAIHETNEEAEHIVSLASILPNLPALRQYVPMMQQFWRSGLFEDMDRRYFRLIDRSGGAISLLAREFRQSHPADALLERFQAVFNHPDTGSYYNKMTHYDMVTNLPALLQVEDRVTMMSSLESRVPLLDHRLTDVVASMPPGMKFRGGELKYILKKVVGDLLPPPVLHRKDKMGFPVPLHLWAKGPAREFISDVLLSRRTRERGIFDVAELERQMEVDTAFSRRLWGPLNLELWYRTFIDCD